MVIECGMYRLSDEIRDSSTIFRLTQKKKTGWQEIAKYNYSKSRIIPKDLTALKESGYWKDMMREAK